MVNKKRSRKINKQEGLTVIGFMMVMTLALAFAYLGMKIVPVYMEYYSAVSALEDMAETPGVAKKPPVQLRRDLRARLYVSYSENIKDRHIKVTHQNGVRLGVVYEVRKSLVGNLDVVMSFDRSVKLRN